MSFSTDRKGVGREAGIYAGRILKGEKPADLPIVRVIPLQIRHQSQDCKRSRARHPADPARPRRRGYRVRIRRVEIIAAPHARLWRRPIDFSGA